MVEGGFHEIKLQSLVTEKEILMDPALYETETLGMSAIELPENTVLYQISLQRPFTFATDI